MSEINNSQNKYQNKRQEIIKGLSTDHPRYCKEWREKNNKKGGYPPLKYWEEKGLYTKTSRQKTSNF